MEFRQMNEKGFYQVLELTALGALSGSLYM